MGGEGNRGDAERPKLPRPSSTILQTLLRCSRDGARRGTARAIIDNEQTVVRGIATIDYRVVEKKIAIWILAEVLKYRGRPQILIETLAADREQNTISHRWVAAAKSGRVRNYKLVICDSVSEVDVQTEVVAAAVGQPDI